MKYSKLILLLFLSIQLNAQWSIIPGTENMDVRDIHINQNTMYLGLGGYGLWRGDASGTWEKFDYEVGLNGVYVRSVCFLGQYIFAGTSSGVFKSSDNGVSWVIADANADFRDIYALELVGGKILAGGNHGLFISSDGGNTFVRNETTFASESIRDILVTDDYIYTTGSKSFASADGGDNWVEVYYEGGYRFGGFSLYYAEGIVFGGHHGDGVFVTDGVANWTPRNSGIETTYADDIDGVDSTLTLAAWGTGVFISEDLGFNWTDVTGNLPNAYPQCIGIFGGYVYVGIIASGSDGLYRMPLPGTPVAIEGEEELPAGYVLKQNYPNPFNPSTKISFELPEQSDVKLEIYDVLGRKVVTLVNELLNAGSHNQTWDASSFPSGTYFYKLETENFSTTKKMLILK